MSGGYAARLSEFPNKGICGLPEIIDSNRVIKNKLSKFADLVKSSSYITLLTGAGISTSAGIPDFRGPNGIWTAEKTKKRTKSKYRKENNSNPKKLKRVKLENDNQDCEKSPTSSTDIEDDSNPKTLKRVKLANDRQDCEKIPSSTTDIERNNDDPVDKKPSPPKISFEKAKPTFTHRAITKLVDCDIFKYVVTQNVDGLHRRSGLPRSKQSVLHGCVFTEKCEKCGKEYFRDFDVGGMSFQKTGRKCTLSDCEGDLRDVLLDWLDELPNEDYELARDHCEKSDLIICLATSLRIEPAASLAKLGKKFVIVNLQNTPYDNRAELIVRAKVDDVMSDLMQQLGIELDSS